MGEIPEITPAMKHEARPRPGGFFMPGNNPREG